MTVLKVQDLTKYFGGFRAVANLSFAVARGEILGLVGPNGAGKTTTFNIITGVHRPTAGRVVYRGEDVTGLPTDALAWKGLVRTFQQTKVFGRLTVEENVAIGCHKFERGGLRRTLMGMPSAEHDGLRARIGGILEFTGLLDRRERVADELPYGDQRILGMAIALGAEPDLLLLDEPLAGMNPTEADGAMTLIHQIRDRGVTVLLIDHHMDTLMKHCDRLVVMHHGEKLAEGSPAVVRDDPSVIATYLGAEGGGEPGGE
jgi:branched-chain amino acid transport system ATP-binding protein